MRNRPAPSPWACDRCASTTATEMCVHVHPDGSLVTFCSPTCLALYLEERKANRP